MLVGLLVPMVGMWHRQEGGNWAGGLGHLGSRLGPLLEKGPQILGQKLKYIYFYFILFVLRYKKKN